MDMFTTLAVAIAARSAAVQAAAQTDTTRADTIARTAAARADAAEAAGVDSARRRRWPREYCATLDPEVECVRVVPFELFLPRGGGRAGTGPRIQPHLGIEAGVLRNRGRRSARGVTVLLGVGDADPERLGVRLRYRRWLAPRAALPSAVDVGAGPLVAAVHTGPDTGAVRARPRHALGLGGEVAVEVGGVVGVSARPEVVWAQRRAVGAVGVGVRTGPRLTAGVARLFGTLAAALLGGALR